MLMAKTSHHSSLEKQAIFFLAIERHAVVKFSRNCPAYILSTQWWIHAEEDPGVQSNSHFTQKLACKANTLTNLSDTLANAKAHSRLCSLAIAIFARDYSTGTLLLEVLDPLL